MLLRLATVIADTDAEGPGRRFALWVQGCSIRCVGCCNPEMFDASGGELADSAELAARALATPDLEGVSILGGEPFEQPLPLADFAARVRRGGLSVMVYTGHVLEDLRAREDAAPLLASTDLLADGPFEARHPERARRWLGSTNQRLHFLSDRYAADDPRFVADNEVEIRFDGRALVVNGWPAGARRVVRR